MIRQGAGGEPRHGPPRGASNRRPTGHSLFFPKGIRTLGGDRPRDALRHDASWKTLQSSVAMAHDL